MVRGVNVRRDGAYRVYLVVAVGLVAVAPLVRMLFLALLEPSSLVWLSSGDFAGQVHLLAAAVVPVGLIVGTVRGSALLSPFATVTLASNHLPRRVTLRRAFQRTLLVVSVAAVGLAVLLGSALVVGAAGSPLAALNLVAAAAALACLGVVAALVGELLGSARAWGAAALFGAFGLSPIGIGAWLSSTWADLSAGAAASGSVPAGTGGAGLGGVLCLAAAAVLALACVPALLDRLRGDVLLMQARRREAAQMAVATGELSDAAAPYREPPTIGRRLPAVVGGPRAVAMLVRDAVGALRTPQRTVLGVAGLACALLLLGVTQGPGGVGTFAAVAAALGSVAVYLSLGAFSDGFRQAAEAAAGPAVFGTPVGEQFLLHAVFPVLLVVLTVGVTAMPSGGSLAPLLGGLAIVAVRAYEAARGSLPPLLLTPMPSEIGDLSALARLVWQFDSVLIAAGLGAATMLSWSAGLHVLSFAVLGAGASVLALATRVRLRQSRG